MIGAMNNINEDLRREYESSPRKRDTYLTNAAAHQRCSTSAILDWGYQRLLERIRTSPYLLNGTVIDSKQGIDLMYKLMVQTG